MMTDALDSLSVHLREAERLIAALRSEIALPDAPSPQTVEIPAVAAQRRLMTTDWPKVGGRDLVVAQTDVFSSEAFRSRWRPSGERRALYVGASEGLRDLSREIHIPLFKLGVTDADGVWHRMRALRRAGYASAWYQDGRCVEDARGWKGWFASQIYPRHRLPSPGSPVSIDSSTIYIDLPEGLHWTEFDAAFDAETACARLSAWVQTEVGRGHCQLLGLDPARFQRLTHYAGGEDGCLRQATEICCFTLYGGADRLVEIAERIILRHMGLLPAMAATVSDAAETSSEAA